MSVRDRLLSKWWIVVGLVLLFGAPDIARFVPSVPLLVIQQGILFGMAAVGLNLLLRHIKLVSFGHAAFFGTGAYTVALLASTNAERLLGAPDVAAFVPLLLAATGVATVMAAIIGYLSLRYTGLYFSLLTLAFGQLLYAIVNGNNALLGGSDGLGIRPGSEGQVTMLGAHLGDHYSLIMYYVSAILLVLGLYAMYRIVNSPFGKALDAIGQDRTRAEFIGLPVKRYIWVAFVISGVYTGIAGALFAMTQQYINPMQTLYFLRSGDILFMAILGGFQTLVGPVIGGVVLEFLLFIGEDIAGNLDSLVAGIALLVLVYGFPRGIVGSLREGGVVHDGLDRLRHDPTVLQEWIGRVGTGVVSAGRRSIDTVRTLIFGVS
ncbi:MAG: branched-chain amino acid ABC transporter permease [Halanaeroarchaeum sp.]